MEMTSELRQKIARDFLDHSISTLNNREAEIAGLQSLDKLYPGIGFGELANRLLEGENWKRNGN